MKQLYITIRKADYTLLKAKLNNAERENEYLRQRIIELERQIKANEAKTNE